MSNHSLPRYLRTPLLDQPKVAWPESGEPEAAALSALGLSGGWATEKDVPGGTPIEQFEAALAELHDVRYAICVTNGTHTLQLMLEAEQIGIGDVVVVPGMTWQATAGAVLDAGALPWLVDVDPLTGTISPEAVVRAIEEARAAGFTPRALFAVHLYCRHADLDALQDICRRAGLVLFEDAAHAHGAQWRGSALTGKAMSLSHQRSKVLTTGEGGTVLTNDGALARALRTLRDCGRRHTDDAPVLQSGNWRMTELQAAVGLCQVDRFRAQQALRRATMAELERVATGLEGITPLPRLEGTTEAPQYKWGFTYDPGAFDGLPIEAARRALELDLGGTEVTSPYEPLTASDYYQPLSKPWRYGATDEVTALIDPARYHLPGAETYWRSTVLFENTFALDSDAPSLLFNAVNRLRRNAGDVAAWNVS